MCLISLTSISVILLVVGMIVCQVFDHIPGILSLMLLIVLLMLAGERE